MWPFGQYEMQEMKPASPTKLEVLSYVKLPEKNNMT